MKQMHVIVHGQTYLEASRYGARLCITSTDVTSIGSGRKLDLLLRLYRRPSSISLCVKCQANSEELTTKTRRDETRKNQAKTTNDKTRQDKTRQDKTGFMQS